MPRLLGGGRHPGRLRTGPVAVELRVRRQSARRAAACESLRWPGPWAVRRLRLVSVAAWVVKVGRADSATPSWLLAVKSNSVYPVRTNQTSPHFLLRPPFIIAPPYCWSSWSFVVVHVPM